MITIQNFKDVLLKIGFTESSNGVYSKNYPHFEHFELKVDFNEKKIVYPRPITLGDTTTSNFEHPENFVVLECVTRLLDKGYQPKHLGLEKRWQVGRGASGGKADICVTDENGSMLFIVECKTAGKEYRDELKKMNESGGQLFSYLQQERGTRWLVLYASDLKDENVEYDLTVVKSTDDANILKMSKKDRSVQTYANAHTVEDLFNVWTETYSQTTQNDIIFSADSVAYNIGKTPLRKKDLIDFRSDDKIVNRFEEILRHNNVSDKENAFNRLIALFICKLVDEIKKTNDDVVDFQYKVGTDTYESLQDRLQRLHMIGMKEFMQEEINYIDDEYADRVFSQYGAGKRKKAIEDLRQTLRILKYYTNNDFSFKDVHNEELFYQNGKVLVEVVQLFEKYRIVYPSKHQFLGDLFENLLAKGFKQNEGQFFTPIPITRFIWDCLPLDKVVDVNGEHHLPKVIDYACGAGHFLTEAVEAINAYFHFKEDDEQIKDNLWVEKYIAGIEKDYRLARVAKVSLYMNGAGKGQIVFGDGLEQYPDKGITNGSFDILVANPPYSVDAFKAHLKLKNNSFDILPKISNTGKEIETLFVERIAQLLKPKGIAAVLLPSTILSNDNSESYTAAREKLLQNFNLRAVVLLGSKTFGATNTQTVVLFLEKYNEPPKRREQIEDSVNSIFLNEISEEWEDSTILEAYTQHIEVTEDSYISFIKQELSLEALENIPYFAEYLQKLVDSTEVKQLMKKRTFISLSDEDKKKALLELYYKKITDVEKEKIYYFALVYQQNTLIITSPSDNDEQKEFLGYEWSTRRGNEGLQEKNKGGMLYDYEDRYADYTLASLVRASFSDLQATAPGREQYYKFARLQDMIEFTRPSFNKAIRLKPDRKVVIHGKFQPVKLGSFADIQKGQSITQAETTRGQIKVVAGGTDYAYLHGKSNREANTITISASGANAGFVNFWREPIFASDCTTVRGRSDLESQYLFYLLQSVQEKMYNLQDGAAQPHVYPDDISAIQVPELAEDNVIIQKIVEECNVVEEEYLSNVKLIKEKKEKIQNLFEELQNNKKQRIRLSNTEFFDISIGKRVLSSEVNSNYDTPVYSANVFTPFGKINKLLLEDFSKDSVLWGIDGDWMVNVIKANNPFYPTDHCGVLRIKTDTIIPRYMAYLLQKEGERTGFSRTYRASIDRIEGISVDVVDVEKQRPIVAKVEKLEAEIKNLQAIIDTCLARKKVIIDNYLND